MADKVFE